MFLADFHACMAGRGITSLIWLCGWSELALESIKGGRKVWRAPTSLIAQMLLAKSAMTLRPVAVWMLATFALGRSRLKHKPRSESMEVFEAVPLVTEVSSTTNSVPE
jgi:hypothetical protein